MQTAKLEKMFEYINSELFSDELPTPYIYTLNYDARQKLLGNFNGVADFYGVCIPEGAAYFIGIADDSDKNETFNCMVHEMIHIWQMENKKPVGHSGWFVVWCRKAIDCFYGEFTDA